MKYIKIFMLLVAVSLFAACSDDKKVNSNECTLGFESTELTVSETAGYVQIPIAVEGRRNGHIGVTIAATPVGNSRAIEDQHYRITDKTLNLNADTLSTGTIDVEVQIINDDEINDDRQFQLTIESVEGATVTTKTITVTIKDEDDNMYESFFGTWRLSGYSLNFNVQGMEFSTPFTQVITISGTTNEDDPSYENTLTATALNMLGYNEELTMQMKYSYDEAAKEGTIGFIVNRPVGEVAASATETIQILLGYQPKGDMYLGNGPMLANWEQGEDGRLPATISFVAADEPYNPLMPGDVLMAGYNDTASGQFMIFNAYTNIVMTKVQ